MNPSVTVLMYHAIADSTDRGADPQYTVGRPRFAEHLRVIHKSGRIGSSVRALLDRAAVKVPAKHADEPDRLPVGMTFDDGHESNLHAAETLAAVGMSADFFINPSTVGTACFLDWQALRAMQQMGMSIQSHGMTHRYLNDLTGSEVLAELANSKAAIEDRLGAPVTMFAPPGGRKPEGFAGLAAQAGYEAICSSDVGVWQWAAHPSRPFMVPRMAVLAATSSVKLGRWVAGSQFEITLMRARGEVLALAKRAVGNQRYERLRERLVGASPLSGAAGKRADSDHHGGDLT